ncbi:hypothetical protein GCM10017687_13150 [Streptomyces echinatus]
MAPPKSGKTVLLQRFAAAVAGNHPECRLLVVLLDERPEEVTEMRRSVRGEVYASTFDRSPKEHIALAELVVERAKRLVEAGEDVVMLLGLAEPGCAGPTTTPRPPAAAPSAAVSTRARCSDPSGSSAPRARRGGRLAHHHSPPPWWTPAPVPTATSSRS